MIIREAVQSDADGISLLISTLSKKHIAPSCTNEGVEILLASMTVCSIKQYLNEDYHYYVAEEEEGLIGVVGMKNNSEIYHLFVSDSHQGQGLSRKLWEVAKSACLLNNNKGFFTVNSAVNAKHIYLKFGFLPIDDVLDNLGIKEIPMQLHC
mgnify:CR=1 FL=1